MDRLAVAAWRFRAALELLRAMRANDGSLRAAERLRAARAEAVRAERVVLTSSALLGEGHRVAVARSSRPT
jgi:hypothetical protein